MADQQTFTEHEILTQFEAWNDALDVVESSASELRSVFAKPYRQVLFTGCGSTHYLSMSAAALFQEHTGQISRAVPGGELLLNPETVTVDGGETLLVAISRSGSTTETVRAVEQFKAEKRGPVIAITNYGNQPLTNLADVPLVIEKGQEQSVAQTRSFASMFVAVTAATMVASRCDNQLNRMRQLPDLGQRLVSQYTDLVTEIGEDLSKERFYFLGNAARYGLASEVNLKMKEMTLTHSEPFYFMEFRHGPMSMVNDSAVIIGLTSEGNQAHELKVLAEMSQKGGSTLSLGEWGTNIVFDSGIEEGIRNVLNLPLLQLMACKRAIAKGLNPDRPNNLTAVVKLDL